MKVWDEIIRKISLDNERLESLCNTCIAIGQKWSYIPDVIQNLSTFIHNYLNTQNMVNLKEDDKLA